jgi:hypothetical protein
MELDLIMNKYGTDKRMIDNGYSTIYENYFSKIKDENLKILEIGIFRPPGSWQGCVAGASLKSWRDYFVNSKIFGADWLDFSDVDDDRIKTIIVNQEKREDLDKIINEFGDSYDIIIDDGGHSMLQQQLTLAKLFKSLKSGGVYVIEDLLTSYIRPEEYNRENTTETTLKILKDFNQDGRFKSDFMEEEEINYIIENIKEINIHMANHGEIAFIFKK